ncbi:fatty acid-binding protein, liver-like [Mercenaria mercenaria]|uniref:fatty acid-binding protein, liver-like n=1 Tax=Mercenaria mercenaria TaxID=6596 RepID=UPI00234E9ABF|nr:fatty acid-binding protein, liver-like [Mercenaria mercenaria]
MAKVVGFWKLETQDDNWDEYMKAVGVGFATRQIGKRTSSWEEIKEQDGVWTLDITSTFKNAHLKFKLGEEFDEKTMDGREVKSVFNVEDHKLVHYQKSTAVGVPDSVVIRERIDDDTMTITFEAIGKNIKAIRRFSKQVKAGS